MPDITLCNDDKCHLKNKCYRFMAIPSNHRQSYFSQTPRIDYECDYFCPIESGQSIKDINNADV
jgi:hypothetical protein